MDLQFQDRNSQIAENAVNVMRTCAELLASIQTRAEAVVDMYGDDQSTLCEKNALESVFSVIKLGDIRYQYMDALRSIGTGFAGAGVSAQAEAADDDVSLF